jgi:hypothetical protein
VVKAASLVMDRSLSRKPFGLDFQGADRNVLLLNPQWTYNGNDPKSQSFESFQSDSDFVEVFNVQRSPGEIKAILNSTFTGPSGEVLRPECKIKTGKFHGGIAQEFSGDPEGTVHCWQVKESGIEFPAQYTSGVMTRSLAQIGLIPGCQLDFCQTTILVTAAAAQQQLAGPSDYQDYLRP